MSPSTSSWLNTDSPLNRASNSWPSQQLAIPTVQPVYIIEAMKLMNELVAEVSGKIVEIVVENSQPVEFGQRPMRVKPS